MPQTVALRPAQLTLVALLLILWHAALAVDYLNHHFALSEALPAVRAQMPLAELWAKVAWAMTVWLGLAGALFLLWRDDAAVLLLFAAAVAMLVAMIALVLAVPAASLFAPPLAALVPALVFVPLYGWLYARGLKRSGVLH